MTCPKLPVTNWRSFSPRPPPLLVPLPQCLPSVVVIYLAQTFHAASSLMRVPPPAGWETPAGAAGWESQEEMVTASHARCDPKLGVGVGCWIWLRRGQALGLSRGEVMRSLDLVSELCGFQHWLRPLPAVWHESAVLPL